MRRNIPKATSRNYSLTDAAQKYVAGIAASYGFLSSSDLQMIHRIILSNAIKFSESQYFQCSRWFRETAHHPFVGCEFGTGKLALKKKQRLVLIDPLVERIFDLLVGKKLFVDIIDPETGKTLISANTVVSPSDARRLAWHGPHFELDPCSFRDRLIDAFAGFDQTYSILNGEVRAPVLMLSRKSGRILAASEAVVPPRASYWKIRDIEETMVDCGAPESD